jgi:ribosome maturation factor RimP
VRNLVGKIVEVQTIETMYTGELIEVGENEVYIQSDSGWIAIPVEKITDIKEKED